MTLVDTNVLLDIATNDPKWARWSLHQLDAASVRGPVLINAVVYAEFSVGYAPHRGGRQSSYGCRSRTCADAAPGSSFFAGKAFERYRTQRGTRSSVLPDFFVGAHAAVLVAHFGIRAVRPAFPAWISLPPTRAGADVTSSATPKPDKRATATLRTGEIDFAPGFRPEPARLHCPWPAPVPLAADARRRTPVRRALAGGEAGGELGHARNPTRCSGRSPAPLAQQSRGGIVYTAQRSDRRSDETLPPCRKRARTTAWSSACAASNRKSPGRRPTARIFSTIQAITPETT